MIETYEHKSEGYNPFLIREGWQVAQLNYEDTQGMEAITKIDMHMQTDEVFVLLKGTAVLIAASESGDLLNFECIHMQPRITYNIPVNTWHNIAMDMEAAVLIVEEPDPVVDPPAPSVELDCAKAKPAVPARKVAASAALRILDIIVGVSSPVDLSGFRRQRGRRAVTR